MVSLLRRPFGFAVLCSVLTAFLAYFSLNAPIDTRIITALVLVVFTIAYVLLVKAHLSNNFRLRASIYIPLIAIVLSLIAMQDSSLVLVVLKDIQVWITATIAFVINFIAISLGNWIASFFFKGKGHI